MGTWTKSDLSTGESDGCCLLLHQNHTIGIGILLSPSPAFDQVPYILSPRVTISLATILQLQLGLSTSSSTSESGSATMWQDTILCFLVRNLCLWCPGESYYLPHLVTNRLVLLQTLLSNCFDFAFSRSHAMHHSHTLQQALLPLGGLA